MNRSNWKEIKRKDGRDYWKGLKRRREEVTSDESVGGEPQVKVRRHSNASSGGASSVGGGTGRDAALVALEHALDTAIQTATELRVNGDFPALSRCLPKAHELLSILAAGNSAPNQYV